MKGKAFLLYKLKLWCRRIPCKFLGHKPEGLDKTYAYCTRCWVWIKKG